MNIVNNIVILKITINMLKNILKIKILYINVISNKQTNFEKTKA